MKTASTKNAKAPKATMMDESWAIVIVLIAFSSCQMCSDISSIDDDMKETKAKLVRCCGECK